MAVMQQQLTLEEFLKLPEEKPALEFEEGRIIQKVSPKARHSAVQLRLCELFNGVTRRRRLALAFPALRATFGGRSYVPDVSVIRWDRLPRAPDGTIADDFVAPPDIAVEIVSPEQGVNTLVRRCIWYVENGVRQPSSSIRRTGRSSSSGRALRRSHSAGPERSISPMFCLISG